MDHTLEELLFVFVFHFLIYVYKSRAHQMGIDEGFIFQINIRQFVALIVFGGLVRTEEDSLTFQFGVQIRYGLLFGL